MLKVIPAPIFGKGQIESGYRFCKRTAGGIALGRVPNEDVPVAGDGLNHPASDRAFLRLCGTAIGQRPRRIVVRTVVVVRVAGN